MPVLMTLQVEGDADAIERYARENADAMRSIADNGKQAGAIHHAFYASDDGRIMVLDEWDSRESFQGFFDAEGERIRGIMDAAGVSTEPVVAFWRKLELHDGF